jgi:transcriptional regulator with XRE-family HTH domain
MINACCWSTRMTPSVTSPTARFLDEAIRNSSLTQSEIAARAGFAKPNVLSMMKLGLTKVPLTRIPGLAGALGVDRTVFLEIALAEYHPEVHEILTEVLGLPLDPDEEDLVALFRMANLDGNIRLEGALKIAVENLFELARQAAD